MFETTRGLVLRSVRYKESDKILTVLTESEGKLTLRARGALRKGGKLAAATELYTLSDMTLFSNRGRWQLNEAQTIEQFIHFLFFFFLTLNIDIVQQLVFLNYISHIFYKLPLFDLHSN